MPSWFQLHMPHLITLVFVFCFGACVGSFLNVVIYRLPMGMSVTTPPSRCPTCGARLRFFSENLPIVGWLLLRGKCRYCGVKISPQYMTIELLIALMFAGLYMLFYMVPPGVSWWGEIGGQWWYRNGPVRTAPTFIAFAFLIAGLVAMTVIDARTFTIPMQIPLFLTFTAFLAYPLQALIPLQPTASQTWPIQSVGWQGTAAAMGGMLGILIGLYLLKSGRLRYSFADYHTYVREGEALAEYPHARREMGVEVLYLLPCLAGMTAGWLLGGMFGNASPPVLVQALGASFMGYLVGGGLVWGVRILGSLAFGREAMGLGDVHLMGAVGAVLGWFDPIIIFFLAPFSGLTWAIVSKGIAALFKKVRRELPYGPHLALATGVLIFCRPAVQHLWAMLFPMIPWPQPGLVP